MKMTDKRTSGQMVRLQSDKSGAGVVIERGTLLGREITSKEERKFLLTCLAAARRKMK
jgi:hypothetical protein